MSKTNQKKLFLILGDQLFQQNVELSNIDFVMIESSEICSRFKYHKQKLAFIFGCMREHRDFLRNNQKQIYYTRLEEQKEFETVLKTLSENYNSIEYYDISDKGFSKKINELAKTYFKNITIHENPQFLTTKNQFKEYLTTKNKRLLMNDFYIWQRKRLNLLLDSDNNPVGGSWSYDANNRKKLPKAQAIPNHYKPIPTNNYLEARESVLEFFPNNPGLINDLWLPTNYEQAELWLKDFLENKLINFGNYEDALTNRDPFLFHSLLSPIINNGLITPQLVLEKLLEYCENNPSLITDNLNSIEGFVRHARHLFMFTIHSFTTTTFTTRISLSACVKFSLEARAC